jgi:hypothetical protein
MMMMIILIIIGVQSGLGNKFWGQGIIKTTSFDSWLPWAKEYLPVNR